MHTLATELNRAQVFTLSPPSEVIWRSHVTFPSLRVLVCKPGVRGGDTHITGCSEGQMGK